MIIGQIKDGIVLDHITAGKSMEIYEVLKLDKLDCNVAMIQNADSEKMGKKDIIKLNGDVHIDMDALGYVDPNATGLIAGLTTRTRLPDIYRAILEGITFEMRHNMDRLSAGGVQIKRLLACGGGARSSVWMQIKADITGLPVHTLENPEAGAVGCIMLGAVAGGYYKDLYEASEALVRIKDTYLPNPAMHDKYAVHYERYCRLYDAVKGIYGLQNPYK